MTIIGLRTAELRIGIGLSQSGLAKRIGVPAQSIQQLEAGKVASPRYLVDLAKALHTTPGWLMGDDEAVPPVPQRPRPPLDLPVLGMVVGGNDGEFSLNGEVYERVARPDPLMSVDNAYALYVTGSSMEPRYFDDEILYVNPNRPVGIGSFVVVQLRDGRAMVKRLVRQDSNRVVLEQYNPPKSFEIPRRDIERMHMVVQSGQR